MGDVDRELTELRREIVEARNQAIKTDNQVKNLSLDVKGFEKRFDLFERRTRIAGLGANLIVAVTIIAAGYFIHSVRVRNLTQALEGSVAAAAQAKKTADAAAAASQAKGAALDEERALRERSAAVAVKLVDLLDRQREREAIDLLDKVDIASLTPLERKLLDKRVGELRVATADAAYKAGRAAQLAGRADAAVSELRRAVAVEPDGRVAPAARYYLATQLWISKRHEEAEAVMRDILKKDADKGVLEEMRYLVGTSLTAQGKRDEARVAFTDVVQRGGKYAAYAREQLEMLDGGARRAPESAAPAAVKKPGDPGPGAAPAAAKKPGDPDPGAAPAAAKKPGDPGPAVTPPR